MKVIKIDKKDWAGGIDKIQDAYRLFGPVKDEKFHDFKQLAKGRIARPEFFKHTPFSKINCLSAIRDYV